MARYLPSKWLSLVMGRSPRHGLERSWRASYDLMGSQCCVLNMLEEPLDYHGDITNCCFTAFFFLLCWIIIMCWYHTMLCSRIQFHYISYLNILHRVAEHNPPKGPSNIITYHQIIQTSDPHRPGCSLLADCLGMWRRPVTSWSESPESNPLQLNCRACRQLTEHSVAHDWETTRRQHVTNCN